MRVALILALLWPSLALAQNPAATPSPSLDFAGLVALSATARVDPAFAAFFDLRFIPELKFSLALSPRLTLDAEASANAFLATSLPLPDAHAVDGDVSPYRAWVRLSTSRFEARVGLQKLSFGSAAIFRPLMWFDSLDPRDPLQLTDGVTGLLLRYYPAGNVNLWAWGLCGNSDPRGFDLAPSDDRTAELGGRAQVPFLRGEIAATYHRRRADINGLVFPDTLPPDTPLPLEPVPEDRFGLDGKWDVGVGLWFEAALVHQRTDLLAAPFHPYQRALTLGLDYTFALGRGLTAVAEHFRFAYAPSAFGSAGDLALSLTGLLLRYPLGLLDELQGIFYYDWEGRGLYRFLGWKRTTDALSLSLIVFWNPADPVSLQLRPAVSSFAGTGLRLVLAHHF